MRRHGEEVDMRIAAFKQINAVLWVLSAGLTLISAYIIHDLEQRIQRLENQAKQTKECK